MFEFMRLGTAAIAAAILWGALRLHRIDGDGHAGKGIKDKSRGWARKHAKSGGTILAFISGLALLVTVVGSWMLHLGNAIGAFAVAALIACILTLIIDWGIDGKPDKPAFWASFALAFLLVLAVAQLPSVGDQIGDGAQKVGDQMSSTFHDAKGR